MERPKTGSSACWAAHILLRRNLLTYGLGGVLMPFPFIKGIDLALVAFGLA